MLQKVPVSVLVAPLDWGLGHATRCIPIIRQLVDQGAQVVIAAGNAQKTLLKEEFPDLEFIDIPGYEMSYRSGILLKWGLIWKVPAILRQIKRENKWLEGILAHRRLDAVISDNRYGLYNKKIFSVFITHQLGVRSGWGRIFDRMLLKWNYRFIRNFSACWVPDLEGKLSLAGKLSHPPRLPPIPLTYLGVLSRMQPSGKEIEKKSLLILLSGPEPQRTRFEKILFRELISYTGKTVLVRGLPGSRLAIPFIRESVSIFNHLPSHELNGLLNCSEFILARSGYSTIMDLVQIKRNAIVVATPGQTEQEYLGNYLYQMKWMYRASQNNFKLEKVLREFQQEKLKLPDLSGTSIQRVIKEFLGEITDC
jgi:hypothetical protein